MNLPGDEGVAGGGIVPLGTLYRTKHRKGKFVRTPNYAYLNQGLKRIHSKLSPEPRTNFYRRIP